MCPAASDDLQHCQSDEIRERDLIYEIFSRHKVARRRLNFNHALREGAGHGEGHTRRSSEAELDRVRRARQTLEAVLPQGAHA